MTGVKHAFTSGKADDADATLVNPSDWNDEHEPNLTTKGDIIVRGASSSARFPVGSNGQGIIAASAESLGIKYAALVSILDRDLASVDVVNTTGETTIYSFTLPAGELGSTGGLRLTIGGDILNNTGGFADTNIKIKLGSTTVFNPNRDSWMTSAQRSKWQLDILLLNVSLTSQKWVVAFVATRPATLESAYPQVTHSDRSYLGAGVAVSAEDTAQERLLDITATQSEAHASFSFRKEFAVLEKLSV